jgi:hypothetical protein
MSCSRQTIGLEQNRVAQNFRRTAEGGRSTRVGSTSDPVQVVDPASGRTRGPRRSIHFASSGSYCARRIRSHWPTLGIPSSTRKRSTPSWPLATSPQRDCNGRFVALPFRPQLIRPLRGRPQLAMQGPAHRTHHEKGEARAQPNGSRDDPQSPRWQTVHWFPRCTGGGHIPPKTVNNLLMLSRPAGRARWRNNVGLDPPPR